MEESGLLQELEQLGFGIVGYACTTCNGMSGALDPKIQQGNNRTGPVFYGSIIRKSQL